jgi:two-component system, LytTR family, sensor kinase
MNVLNEMAMGSNRDSFNGSLVVKDRFLKMLLVPFLGCVIPFLTGLVNFSSLPLPQLIFSLLFFVLITQVTWQGSIQMVSFLRSRKWLRGNIFARLSVYCTATTLYGITVVFFSAAGWQLILFKKVMADPLTNALIVTGFITIVLTLMYEAAFLSAEVDLDEKVMQQLDFERLQAEANTVKSDLDPHFLFNCLNTLSYLVRHDSEQAYHFVHKLSNVFKYLLTSKQKEIISLKEELAFLEDYYFLLRVRFDEAIRIEHSILPAQEEEMTVPGTLQVLVENAIKRNFFSEKEPLVISIQMNNQYLTVSTPATPKQKKNAPAKSALSLLSQRYRMLLNKEVLTQETEQQYLIKVPRIKKMAA